MTGTAVTTRAALFWAKVRPAGGLECWLWTGALSRAGYGRFGIGNGRAAMAHRWCYEQLVGPIPEGLQLDHLCRVRRCVNPWHLDPVTCRVNLLRGEGLTAKRAAQTHCIRGHEFSAANTVIKPNGCRTCRECGRVADARYYRRKKVAS